MKAKVKAWLRLRLKHHNHHKASYQWNNLISSRIFSTVISDNTVSPAYHHTVIWLALWVYDHKTGINIINWASKERDTGMYNLHTNTPTHSCTHTHTHMSAPSTVRARSRLRVNQPHCWCVVLFNSASTPLSICNAALVWLPKCLFVILSARVKKKKKRKAEVNKQCWLSKHPSLHSMSLVN